MIPTTLYRATSAKASVKSRLAAASRSAGAEAIGFGRVVASREIKRAAPALAADRVKPTTASITVAPAVQRTPSFVKIVAGGGLTWKQAQRLMADAAAPKPIARETLVTYQRPSVALHQFTAAVLCGTTALIVATFFSLLLN